MKAMEEFCRVMQDFEGEFDFAVIYVEEAHATDGEWPITTKGFAISTHQNMEDRANAARQLAPFVNNCPIYLDNIDNEACIAYGAFPERYYVIIDGVVRFMDGEGAKRNHLSELGTVLKDLQNREKSD